MPIKPKRPCSRPGCPKLTDGRFCEEHAKEEAKRYERYQSDLATRKLYGRTWRKAVATITIISGLYVVLATQRSPPAKADADRNA